MTSAAKQHKGDFLRITAVHNAKTSS